jgi:uridine kinase
MFKTLMIALLSFAAPLSAQVVVGIAGGTGSGKTTLANKIMETFSGQAILINQDSYYKDLSHMTLEERKKQNFDHPDAIDFELLKTHLSLLKKGQAIQVPTYDFHTDTRTADILTVEPADIIILEGILIFAVAEIRDLCDLKIFVETDDDIRLLRRIERDMRERGRDLKSIHDQYMATVKPMHDAYVEPSKQYADLIMPTHKHNDKGIALIVSSLKKEHKSELAALRD